MTFGDAIVLEVPATAPRRRPRHSARTGCAMFPVTSARSHCVIVKLGQPLLLSLLLRVPYAFLGVLSPLSVRLSLYAVHEPWNPIYCLLNNI